MADNKPTGRTPSDALVEVLSSWRLLILVFGALVIVFFTVHFSAEPGTQIEFLGVIKYQKAKPRLDTPRQSVGADASSYLLPRGVRLVKGSYQAIPVLDGSIALSHQGRFASSGVIVGANIGKIRVGARKVDGTPYNVYHQDRSAVVFSSDVRIELEYRGRMFAITTQSVKNSEDLLASVESIPFATLDLLAINDLPGPSATE